MAFVDFDPAQPDGSVDNGSAALADIRNNQGALRVYIAAALFAGYTYAQSGGTAAQPTAITLTKGATIIRFTLTWGTTGGELNQPKTILIEISTNSGSSYDEVGTITNTYDAGGELTATSGGGGFLSKLWSLWGLVRKVIADLAAHISGTGTGVHGLGSIATQSAGAVAITGGAVNASLGASTPDVVTAKHYRGTSLAPATTSGAIAVATDEQDSSIHAINGAATFTLSLPTLPASRAQYYTMLVFCNGGPHAVSWVNVSWFGAAPPASLDANKVHLFSFYRATGTATLYGVYAGYNV